MNHFLTKTTCIGCHAVRSVPGATADIGPRLEGLAGRAGKRVAGKPAEEDVKQSILNSEAYIVEGYKSTSLSSSLHVLMSNKEFDLLISLSSGC